MWLSSARLSTGEAPGGATTDMATEQGVLRKLEMVALTTPVGDASRENAGDELTKADMMAWALVEAGNQMKVGEMAYCKSGWLGPFVQVSANVVVRLRRVRRSGVSVVFIVINMSLWLVSSQECTTSSFHRKDTRYKAHPQNHSSSSGNSNLRFDSNRVILVA